MGFQLGGGGKRHTNQGKSIHVRQGIKGGSTKKNWAKNSRVGGNWDNGGTGEKTNQKEVVVIGPVAHCRVQITLKGRPP